MGAIHAHHGLLLAGGSSGDPTAVAIYNKIVAWWEHAGTGGTELLDSHTGVHHLTNPAGSYTAGSSALAAGFSSSILTTNATRLDSAANAALDLTSNFSVMHWFKRSATTQPTFPKIIGKYFDVPNGKANYLLFLNTGTNQLLFRFNDAAGSYWDAASAATIADATTYCAIGTKLATGSELYLNNSLTASQASGGSTGNDSGDGVRNGGSGASTDCLIGNFGAGALFSPALTSTERAYLWNAADGIDYATLKTAAGF